MARKLQPSETDLYNVVNTVNELVDGRSNNVGSAGSIVTTSPGRGFRLTPSATTTTVNFATCSVTSMITITPRTANAAAAVASTYISSLLNGSFILTHANNTQTDRIFDFSCVGG